MKQHTGLFLFVVTSPKEAKVSNATVAVAGVFFNGIKPV
jgi:hypothetical protein